MAPTREQLLAACQHFVVMSTGMIRAERRGLWIMWPLVCWQVAMTVWLFPVTSWFDVAAVSLNIAGAVYGCHVIKRVRDTIGDMTEAREQARRTIEKLGA